MGELRELTTDDEWDRAVPILRQLWSHEDEAFVRSWREEADYRLFGWYVDGGGADADGSGSADGDGADGHRTADDAEERYTASGAELVAVAGISIQRVLHHARHCWIHDFVVDEPRRGAGHGAALLARLEDWARERDCEYVALACWAENDDAREFYESQGLSEWGSVFETEL